MNCSDARMRSTNDATSSGCPTNAARTTSAITGWSASRSGRMTTPSATGGDGNWRRLGNDTLRIVRMNVTLRPVEDRDLDAIYQQTTDPESIRMAAFTAEDQTDRRAFLN